MDMDKLTRNNQRLPSFKPFRLKLQVQQYSKIELNKPSLKEAENIIIVKPQENIIIKKPLQNLYNNPYLEKILNDARQITVPLETEKNNLQLFPFEKQSVSKELDKKMETLQKSLPPDKITEPNSSFGNVRTPSPSTPTINNNLSDRNYFRDSGERSRMQFNSNMRDMQRSQESFMRQNIQRMEQNYNWRNRR